MLRLGYCWGIKTYCEDLHCCSKQQCYWHGFSFFELMGCARRGASHLMSVCLTVQVNETLSPKDHSAMIATRWYPIAGAQQKWTFSLLSPTVSNSDPERLGFLAFLLDINELKNQNMETWRFCLNAWCQLLQLNHGVPAAKQVTNGMKDSRALTSCLKRLAVCSLGSSVARPLPVLRDIIKGMFLFGKWQTEPAFGAATSVIPACCYLGTWARSMVLPKSLMPWHTVNSILQLSHKQYPVLGLMRNLDKASKAPGLLYYCMILVKSLSPLGLRFLIIKQRYLFQPISWERYKAKQRKQICQHFKNSLLRMELLLCLIKQEGKNAILDRVFTPKPASW